MTLKQKILDYLRTHKEPFTLRMLAEATGGREHSIRGMLSEMIQDGLVGFHGPRTHEKRTPGKPFGNWKPREYRRK